MDPAPVRAPGWPAGIALTVTSAAAMLPATLAEGALLHPPTATTTITAEAATARYGA